MRRNEIRKYYIGLTAAALSFMPLSGCADEVTPDVYETPEAATISGAIEGTTRASGEKFDKKDLIGVSCSANADGSPLLADDPMGLFINVPYCFFYYSPLSVPEMFVHPVNLKDEFYFLADDEKLISGFDYEGAKPAIYYLTGETKLFSAYYPYRDLTKDVVRNGLEVKNGEILLHCNAEDAYVGHELDVLATSGAKGGKSLDGGRISFTGDHAFRHGMAKVKLTFKADGYTADEIESICTLLEDKFSPDPDKDKCPKAYLYGVYTEAKFDHVKGEVVTYGDNPGMIDFYKTGCDVQYHMDYSDKKNSYSYFEFYVPPQTCSLKVVYETEDLYIDSETYTKKCYYETPEVRAEFKAGMSYNYTVTLRPHNPSIRGEIAPWVDGGTSGMTGHN